LRNYQKSFEYYKKGLFRRLAKKIGESKICITVASHRELTWSSRQQYIVIPWSRLSESAQKHFVPKGRGRIQTIKTFWKELHPRVGKPLDDHYVQKLTSLLQCHSRISTNVLIHKNLFYFLNINRKIIFDMNKLAPTSNQNYNVLNVPSKRQS